ncbi:hypothetical protein [Ancylothrix sp. D3o]|nr:hypothetical protein [Ancylothrix sp. D3o]
MSRNLRIFAEKLAVTNENLSQTPRRNTGKTQTNVREGYGHGK